MLTYSASVHFRYVLLLNALAALVPTSIVKSRANDPLLHSSWWTLDQHSGVLVVSAAAILGTVLVFLLLRRNLRRWWNFLLSGALTSIFPGLFYLVAAPQTPQLLVVAVAMIIVGLVWGSIIGLVIYAVFGKRRHAPNPNNSPKRCRAG